MVRIIVLMGRKQDREHFEALLNSQSGHQVVGMGTDGYDAIRLAEHHQPDVALVDEQLPMIGQGRLIASMLFRSRETRVIMLTSRSGTVGDTVLQAISSGAAGYLAGGADSKSIVWGIALVMQGGSLMSPETAAMAFRKFPQRMELSGGTPPWIPEMSRQELRLLLCIGQGLSSKDIAKTLKLTEGTVRNYMSSIYSKTGLHNRTEVALFVRQAGLAET